MLLHLVQTGLHLWRLSEHGDDKQNNKEKSSYLSLNSSSRIAIYVEDK